MDHAELTTEQAEEISGKPSMRQKVETMVESGTCNVCSAPCSSCMHLKLAHMGSKDVEFSDENCHVTATSQYSVNEDDAVPSFKNRACDDLLHATCEASNPLSVCSSHDSLSEIADSKANIISDFSEFRIQKLSYEGIVADDQRSLLLKHEDCNTEEGHDDNISCVSGANDASVSAGYSTKNLEKKNLLHSSTLVNILGLEGSGKAIFSHKSDLRDPPSDADGVGSSPKVQNNFLPSNRNAEHSEKDSYFHHKPLEHPVEEMNLFLSKEAACDIAPGKSFTVDSSANAHLNSRNLANGDNFKTSSTVCTKLESELGGKSEIPMDGALKVSQKVEQDEKSNVHVSLAELQDPPSHSIAGDESEESETSEQDVKICDICGDAGREDLLAICCKCSDGAEHTYCMREMLQEVPEGDWLCEECKLTEENENRKQDMEVKKTSKVSAQSSGKRHAEAMEVTSASKRQAIEISMGSPKPSSPGRMPSLSRDNSFKSLDKGKVRPAYPASVGNSGVEISESAHTSSSSARLQTPKGTLLKSNSFSTLISKPKVKIVDEVPQKNKNPKDSFSDTKEASGRMMTKSMSFKSVNSGRALATESKVKMLPSKFSLAPDLKRLKQVKDRSGLEKKNLPKFDRRTSFDKKLTHLGETGIVSSPTNNKDLKTAESDGKLGILSRSNSSIARRGSEIAASSAQASSTNVMNNTLVEQRLNQVSPKEVPSSSSWTAERSSRSMRCQTCKENGHAAEFCPTGSSLASSADAPTRSMREDLKKGSKLKAAIEAAMLRKPGICRKRKEHDQSDGLPSSNADANCDIASHDKLSSLNKISEVTHEGPANSGVRQSASFKQTDMNNSNQLNACSTDAIIPLKVDSDSNAHAVGKSSYCSASNSVHMKMLTIPEHGYIWQGSFEVCRAGKVPDLYGGIQAHLSTCASPKVLEVVKKFPQKITLDEVPRLSTWPRQFHDCGVREDNIALYFFAKDIESYTKNYKGLVDSMIQNDLAFKGSFDGVELFIFPSTQLPENSQRWNLLFYLWGVFKGRRSDISNFSKKSIDKEDIYSGIMSSPGNLHLSESLDKEATACSVSYDLTRGLNDAPHKSHISSSMEPDNTLFASNTNPQTHARGFDSKSLPVVSTKRMVLHPEVRSSSSSLQGEVDVLGCKRATKLEASTKEIGTVDGPDTREEAQIGGGASRLLSTKSFHDGKKNASVRNFGEVNVGANIHKDRDEVKVGRDLSKDNGSMDSLDTGPRKLPCLDQSRATLLTSDGTSERMQRIDIGGTLIGGESASKKLRSCFSGPDEVSGVRDGNSSRANFVSRECDFGSSSSVVEETCDKAPDEKIIVEDLGTTERYFFPVDSHRASDFRLGAYSLPSREESCNDDNQIREVVPNLELALGGAKAKSENKGVLPLLVGMVDKNNNQNNNQYKPPNKVMDKEEEEDGVSASLSLSLSFPFPDKEQNVKSVSKEEQLVPERRDVNTSLLLFGGFSDK